MVNEIKLRGHQIACHSNYHQLIYNQSPEEFEKDLVTATEAIFNASNITPTIYRAPGFSITESTPWAFDILAKNGYKVDCSVFPMRRSHGGLTNFPKKGPCIIRTTDGNKLTCLPINTRRILGQELVYSGGGYFRLTPLSLLDYFFSTDDYVMTYFHPRDFDPYQPMAPGLNFIRRFKSYVGLSSTYKKLSTLLSKFDFLTVDEALNELVKIEVELPEINFYDSEFNFANNFTFFL